MDSKTPEAHQIYGMIAGNTIGQFSQQEIFDRLPISSERRDEILSRFYELQSKSDFEAKHAGSNLSSSQGGCPSEEKESDYEEPRSATKRRCTNSPVSSPNGTNITLHSDAEGKSS